VTSWVTAAQVRERAELPADRSDEQISRAASAASEVLQGLSPVRPVEQVTVAHAPACGCGGELLTGPYGRGDVGAVGVSGPSPFYWRAGSGDLILGGGHGCGHELLLPHNPVLSVTAVDVGGVPLAAGDYELVDARRLRRTAGSWTGEVRVTYRTGSASELAMRAAAALTAELLKAEVGDRTCQLPQRVQTVTRQGVTFALLDPQTFLEQGRTGVYLVDLFLASSRAPRRTVSVTSPDVPRYDKVRG
jgi:hypothetical protein